MDGTMRIIQKGRVKPQIKTSRFLNHFLTHAKPLFFDVQKLGFSGIERKKSIRSSESKKKKKKKNIEWKNKNKKKFKTANFGERVEHLIKRSLIRAHLQNDCYPEIQKALPFLFHTKSSCLWEKLRRWMLSFGEKHWLYTVKEGCR